MVRAVAVLFSGCYLIPFRTAVSFWRQSTQILSSFSSKRDCGAERCSAQVGQLLFPEMGCLGTVRISAEAVLVQVYASKRGGIVGFLGCSAGG